MRQSPVSMPRPRPVADKPQSKVRIVGESFIARFVDAKGNRVLKDAKVQSISYGRCKMLAESTLRTLRDNDVDVTGYKVKIVGVQVR